MVYLALCVAAEIVVFSLCVAAEIVVFSLCVVRWNCGIFLVRGQMELW